MTTEAAIDGPAVRDLGHLEAWMDAQGLPGTGERLTGGALTGGTQNEVLHVRRGDFDGVLRLPPPGAAPGRDQGILREWRILEALAGTGVPHPEAIAVCPDSTVLGRPFYLTRFVDGWSPPLRQNNAWPQPYDRDPQSRAGLAFAAVDGLAELSRVDWQAKGLGDLGRPDGFHDRQVDRWLTFLERVKTRELPGLDEASQWLRSRRPIDFVPGIMHGDYQFANVMFGHGEPARLAAIVDWEMGTIGDPKLDLGWLLQDWPEAPGDEQPSFYLDTTGMPGRSALIARYSEQSGRPVDDIDYYLVLARWKLAIVLEQSYGRATQNATADETLLGFGPVVLELFRRAAELAGTSAYR